MPAESADTASSLEDYLDLLEVLSDLGIEFVVIGGCAVGAYARLLGETVFSRDLDLFVTQCQTCGRFSLSRSPGADSLDPARAHVPGSRR